MDKNYNITKLLHDLTQRFVEVRFTQDFKGMITISWGENLEEHHHIGVPHQSIKDLEKQLASFLAQLNEDLNDKAISNT